MHNRNTSAIVMVTLLLLFTANISRQAFVVKGRSTHHTLLLITRLTTEVPNFHRLLVSDGKDKCCTAMLLLYNLYYYSNVFTETICPKKTRARAGDGRHTDAVQTFAPSMRHPHRVAHRAMVQRQAQHVDVPHIVVRPHAVQHPIRVPEAKHRRNAPIPFPHGRGHACPYAATATQSCR